MTADLRRDDAHGTGIRKNVPHPETGKPQPGTVVDVVEAKEPTTHLKLADGTIIRLRLVIVEAVRLDDPGPDGKTAYNFTTQMVVKIHHPEESIE